MAGGYFSGASPTTSGPTSGSFSASSGVSTGLPTMARLGMENPPPVAQVQAPNPVPASAAGVQQAMAKLGAAPLTPLAPSGHLPGTLKATPGAGLKSTPPPVAAPLKPAAAPTLAQPAGLRRFQPKQAALYEAAQRADKPVRVQPELFGDKALDTRAWQRRSTLGEKSAFVEGFEAACIAAGVAPAAVKAAALRIAPEAAGEFAKEAGLFGTAMKGLGAGLSKMHVGSSMLGAAGGAAATYTGSQAMGHTPGWGELGAGAAGGAAAFNPAVGKLAARMPGGSSVLGAARGGIMGGDVGGAADYLGGMAGINTHGAGTLAGMAGGAGMGAAGIKAPPALGRAAAAAPLAAAGLGAGAQLAQNAPLIYQNRGAIGQRLQSDTSSWLSKNVVDPLTRPFVESASRQATSAMRQNMGQMAADVPKLLHEQIPAIKAELMRDPDVSGMVNMARQAQSMGQGLNQFIQPLTHIADWMIHQTGVDPAGVPTPLKLMMLLGGGAALGGFASGNNMMGGMGSLAALAPFLPSMIHAWQSGGAAQTAATPQMRPLPQPSVGPQANSLTQLQTAGRTGGYLGTPPTSGLPPYQSAYAGRFGGAPGQLAYGDTAGASSLGTP